MSDLAQPAEVFVTPDQRAGVFALYHKGLYIQAYNMAEAIGPLRSWRGTEARILAGRLAGNLGSIRMADWHWVHAWRKDRKHPEALWFFTRYLMGARGSMAAWRFVSAQKFPQDASEELRSHWHSQQAAILGSMRDFDAAEDMLKKAEAIRVEPWTCLEWAGLYTMEDRTEDAEAAARRALDMHPWYRPAVQWVAHFLVQKQRDKEALDLLTEATIRLESGAVWGQLAALQIELKRYDEAWRSLAEFERLSPLLYKDDKSWLDARRCDIECRRGNYDKALEYAKLVDIKKNKYHEGLIKRLSERKEPGKRVETPVPFVRQHHKTCAPATLTSIAKFWQMPAEHVEVAEEITYGGTPHHSERKWAIDNGWFTKSFTVTWDAAVALIDNGIPFTLATMEVSSGHLQAVIGYDSACRNLIIRDPGDRHTMEMPFDWMQERYRSTGPRGMALVPIAQQEKLAALQLPDEGLYENVLKYELALVDHKRNEAGEIVKAMEAAAPGHYLTLSAKRALCIYDADQPAGLIVTEQLLKMFPGDLFLELSRADYLRWLGRYEERIEILKKLAEQKETDPACWHFYAQELSADARNDVQTIYYLRKSIRTTPPQAPLHGRLLNTLARLRWNQRKFDEALQLHHFAACQEDQDEYIAMDYFQAARGRGETEQVLQFLQKRFKRFGAKSAQPARTLYNAYVQLERLGEAYDVLEDAMKRRPKDGDLMTYAAEALVYKGEFDRAIDILATAKGISKPGGWLRTSAFVALQRGDPAQAREFWKELLEKEPLADDAHRMYAQLLSEREGREAAVAHLVAACKRFPYHFGLNRLWYEWLLQDGPAAREPIIKKMIHIHPADVGARISYAYNLLDQDRMDDAIRQLDEAESIDPHSSGVWFAKSDVYKRKNQFEDAQFSLRQAVRLWVDYDFAVRELIWSAENLAERRDALAFIEQELLRQRTFGNGVLALRDAAWNLLPPEELLGSLRRVLAVRPDLWHAWSATIHQLVHMERGDEALETAQKAVQRFPLLPGIWLDLADAHRINKNAQYELDSIRRALQLSPAWNIALRMLVDAHERAGTHQEAKHAIEQAISWAPLTAINYLDYAEYYWRHSAPDDAIKQVRQALKIDPWLDQAWNDLCNWTLQLDRYDEAMSLAKEWTKARPGEARSWLRLAQAIQWQGPKTRTDEEDERINECAKAYDEALKRNPFAGDIHDMKAEMLAFAQRYDDARKACNPPAWKGKAPINLRGRAAWIKSQQGEFDDAKAMMCAALKEDMKYQWGWDRLVDWSFATRQFKEYLDAANDMLRMRPQSAIALTYRGEARLRNEEREAGMEDLKNAFRKDPCIILTGSLLFDEQVIDDNLVGAEATLLSMQQNQIGDFVKARQVQFQCKKENQSLAIDKFRDLCAMRPAFNTQPLDLAMRALDVAGWREQGEQVLKDAMKIPNYNLHFALLLAERWNPNAPNDLPERIAVIDKALERQPGTFRFLDLKAELLTNGHQFERAWSVCQEKTSAIDQFALEGRLAWVMYRSGRQQEGIAKMREILNNHPKYQWGWWQMADWFGRMQNWVEVLTAAEQLVVIAPRDPVGFGYRGQAKEGLGDPQAARTDYIHALDLSPGYMFAAWQLFNMYVRNQEWQRAEKILEKTEKHADKGEWALRKVDMLVYLNRKASFPKEFENLCKNSEKAPWLIDQSLQYLIQVGWWSDAEQVLHRCLDMGPHICDPWVRLRVAMGDRSVRRDIENMASSRPERINCIAAYAIELAYMKDPHGLRDWIMEYEDDIRANTPCWGKIANAFYVAQDWQGIVDWQSDWHDHEKALPSMLLPLMKALRILGQKDEARKVSLHCLTKLNADYGSSFHKVWLMWDQAMDQESAPVQRYLEQADLGGFDGYHQLVAAMVRGLVAMMTDKQNGFARARQLMSDAAAYAPPTVIDPALKNAYQECVSLMAEMRGTFWAKVWRWFRWLFPKMPPAPKPPG